MQEYCDADLAIIALALLDAHTDGISHGKALELRVKALQSHQHLVTRAAIDSLTLQTGAPGAELYGSRVVTAEFAARTRDLMLCGKLAALNVPLNTPIPFVSARTRFGFIGEGEKIPAAKPTLLANQIMKPKAIKGIVVISKELARSSEAVSVMQRLMTDGVVEGGDLAFTDAVAATSARPAGLAALASSVVAGAGVNSAATFETLLHDMLAAFLATGARLRSAAWITTSAVAVAAARLRNAGGALTCPGIVGASGGVLAGIPLHTSDFATANTLILVDGDALFIADAGVVNISISDKALVYLSDDAATVPISAFSADVLALRVVREIDWGLAGSRAIASTGLALPV
jgi:HK97 family phage major capsid protein